ncbi:MAG TPA: ParB/RepB/Spo0J family partition protein [Thermomicrobiales bacterium]|jgi:ParB family chromosome partitioning protein|nr:ParB/RepB/Spo0J family partition protein [Thermomicrobiales bacterium]
MSQPSADSSTPTPARPGNRRGGLGRGLGALIPTGPEGSSATEDGSSPASGASLTTVPIDSIRPNPYQPRTKMNERQLAELAQSIREHGIVQPLIVTRGQQPETYILIAGERRWRASQRAGLEQVPVVVKDAAPQEMLELALVENLVRADLSPLEEALAYRQLIDEFGLTQAIVAERVGRSRVTVTNTLRLLGAPQQIQEALGDGTITEGHARALLGLVNALDQVAALGMVIDRDMTVRQTEALVRRWLAEGAQTENPPAERDAEETRLEDRFRGALGARVTFRRSSRGGGALTIHYSSAEELDGLYDRLVGEDIW